MSGTVGCRFELNGHAIERDVDPRVSLADMLRDDLGLTGTHIGCEHGVCGACSVLLDGASVRSCLVLAAQADGRRITTVEGLGGDDRAARLREAFARHHALQCGFCTPGLLIAALELIDERGDALTDEEVRAALSGNICRCTGYQGIVAAVLEAAA